MLIKQPNKAQFYQTSRTTVAAATLSQDRRVADTEMPALTPLPARTDRAAAKQAAAIELRSSLLLMDNGKKVAFEPTRK